MWRGLTLNKLNSHHSALAKPEKQSAAEERLEQALLKGLSSGPPVPIDRAFWERLNQRAKGTAG